MIAARFLENYFFNFFGLRNYIASDSRFIQLQSGSIPNPLQHNLLGAASRGCSSCEQKIQVWQISQVCVDMQKPALSTGRVGHPHLPLDRKNRGRNHVAWVWNVEDTSTSQTQNQARSLEMCLWLFSTLSIIQQWTIHVSHHGVPMCPPSTVCCLWLPGTSERLEPIWK